MAEPFDLLKYHGTSYSYITGSSALPDIYACALGLVALQACAFIFGKAQVPVVEVLCATLSIQANGPPQVTNHQLEHWISYVDSLEKLWASTC